MTKKGELSKKDSLTGLEAQLQVEILISDLLARFLNIPDALIDLKIEDAIRRIVEFLGLDQGLLVQWGEDATRPLPTHSSTVPGGLPVILQVVLLPNI